MSQYFKEFRSDLSQAGHNWPQAAGLVYQLILLNGYSFNEAHQFVSDLTGECVGTGYARKTLANKTLIDVGSSPTKKGWDCDDIPYTTPTGWTTTCGVIARIIGGDSTSKLCFFLDGGTSPDNFPKTMIGTNFTFIVSASGLILI